MQYTKGKSLMSVGNKRIVGSMASLTILALGLTGCGGGIGEGAENAGGSSVEPGASKEEYIAAFADVEPITLEFQYASPNPKAFSAQRDLEWAETVEEWSGGKITINTHAAGAIAGPTDVPDALADGRLDLAVYYSTYEPQEMAAFVDMTSSLVQLPSSPLIAELVAHAVLAEVGFNTPEVMANYEERGMHVLHPAVPSGNVTAVCREDNDSLADWQAAQIRGNSKTHEIQTRALGGTLTSIASSEGYEGLQRGVIDCSLQSSATAYNLGWLEVAPYIKIPRGASFAPGPSGMVAGTSWETLPLIAQQLMFDTMPVYLSGEHFSAVNTLALAAEAAKTNGGSMEYIDEESAKALATANEEILKQVEDSPNLDGAAMNRAVADSIEKWTGIAEELGYEEKGDVTDFASWYEGSMEFSDRSYLQPFADRLYEEAILPHRPS
jgi:TRAP-type C4-dicarboxylate transport system substrate-binding protein